LFKRYQNENYSEHTPLFYTLKQVCNPTFVCLDLFDKNLFAGKELKFKIYLFNELPKQLENVTVAVKLTGKGLEYTGKIDAGNLKNGEKKIISFKYNIPPGCSTGDSVIKLIMYADGKEISQNEYKFFVLGKEKMLKTVPSEKKIALFLQASEKQEQDSPENTAKILNSLGIKYTRIQKMGNLDKFDILIIAQNSMSAISTLNAQKTLINWLQKGGVILCFEQNTNKAIPFLPGMGNFYSNKTVLADVFDMRHPVFKDLNHWNFRCWNGDDGTISSSHLIPLNMGILAASSGSPHKDKWGMAIAEIGVGKGRVLFSDLLATRQYTKDSAATKYIQNLLSYCLGDNLRKNIYQLEAKKKKVTLDLKINKGKSHFIDLKKIANMGFADKKARDKKGGWIDEGPANDLSEFEPGTKTFLGVPFEIIDPEKNQGKSCVVLCPPKGGRRHAFLPKKTRFDVNKTYVKRIFFLVAAVWSKGNIGEFVINWEDASSPHATVPLEVGVNLRDWSSKADKTLPEGHVAWTSLTGRSIYLIEWKNPEPQSTIRTVDFKSAGCASMIILLGVTVETK